MQQHKPDDATHLLQCSHCIGRARHDYLMACLVLKDMGKGRVKVLVFGERFWRDRDVQKVRYVDKGRLIPIERKNSVAHCK